MKTGKVNRPKRSHSGSAKVRPEYPITDSFASRELPKPHVRKAHDNPKRSFDATPTRAPDGKMPTHMSPNRGSGKEHRIK